MSLFGDLNEVKLLGNMTQDVELRFTNNGNAVGNFSVATNRRFKQGDEWKDASEFHNIVVWGNLAQGLAQRAKKGTRVLVTGRLQTRSWDGQDGQKKYKTEVVADDVYLIDRYEKGKSADLPDAQVSSGSPEGMGDMPMEESPKSAPSKPSKSGSDDMIDPDDLPF